MTTSATSIPTYTAAWSPGHDGTQFYTRTYSASSPRAVVLFVHGFAEHIARYEWAHGVYASKGITVFTYDQRGFGRTALDKDNKSKDSAYAKTSWHDQFSDIEFWLKHLKKEYPELPLFLMGHSMVRTQQYVHPPTHGRHVYVHMYSVEIGRWACSWNRNAHHPCAREGDPVLALRGRRFKPARSPDDARV